MEAVKTIHLTISAVTYIYADRDKGTIHAAIEAGATFLCGNSEVTKFNTLTPSVLTNVSRNSAISTIDAFTPTGFITIVDSEEEAIEKANSRQCGLSAAVFTRDYQRSLRVATELNFGRI